MWSGDFKPLGSDYPNWHPPLLVVKEKTHGIYLWQIVMICANIRSLHGTWHKIQNGIKFEIRKVFKIHDRKQGMKWTFMDFFCGTQNFCENIFFMEFEIILEHRFFLDRKKDGKYFLITKLYLLVDIVKLDTLAH